MLPMMNVVLHMNSTPAKTFRRVLLGISLHAIAAALLSATSAVSAEAQGLLIAPNAIVIDSKTKTGSVTLVNTGDRPIEASMSTSFAYPVTDSTGTMFLKSIDDVTDTMPSAREWIRIYPQKLVLPAGGRRTVRLMVEPAANAATGEFWARLIVTSREAAPQRIAVEQGPSGEARPDVSIGLTLELRSVLGVFYRNGSVSTGVTLTNARAQIHGDSIAARVSMKRTGNAAFVGSLKMIVKDSTGATRKERSLPLGVYYTIDPRVTIPRDGLAPGNYTVTLEAISSRPDVADRLLLPIAPVKVVAPLRIP
jgi:P pilus assembly chaperone PapD